MQNVLITFCLRVLVNVRQNLKAEGGTVHGERKPAGGLQAGQGSVGKMKPGGGEGWEGN
jgi:hypothetical protein